MAETPENATATTAPVPVDTQSVPIPGGLTPPPAATPPPVQTPAAAPQVPQKPGEFFHNMSHAFSGAILGAMAGREKIASYTTDETGKQTPVIQKMTTGDQLRQIARSALLGLSAGAQSGTKRSGLATALAGAGAGAEDAVARAKEQDLLKRKQSTEEFERGQQAMLSKAQNAHIGIETLRLAQETSKATLESQQQVAALGQDTVGAAAAGGNKIVAQDMHMDDIMQFKKDHPEYLNWTPILTKALPKDGAAADPTTGQIPTDRYYSLIEGDKDVKLSPTMINHLKTVKFPGAENLHPDQSIPFNQFKGLWYQGLKMYNEANLDAKNWKEIETHDQNGQSITVRQNEVTGEVQPVINPLTNKPLAGKDDWLSKVETDPTILAGDKAAAAIPQIQSKIATATDPEYKMRLGRALETAMTAQQAYVNEKQSEIRAEQLIRQGSPDDAADALINGLLTQQDMKARGSTPEFIVQSAKRAFEKSGGVYRAADENIAEQLAKSPQNIVFFGSGNSLLRKGGMIDHVADYNGRIPDTGLPSLTKVADWEQLQAGKGPLAGYAAAVLGLADDYSKVMTGGVGSDSARNEALDLVGRAATRAQRNEALRQIAQSVWSQTDGKLGTNQFMRRSWELPQQNLTDFAKKAPPPTQIPAGTVHVQIPGSPAGYISQENLAKFKQDHPNAQVIQ